jgi:hypothetical protein
MFVKLYTKDDLKLDSKSTDEPQYMYEAYIGPQALGQKSIPGKVSIENTMHFDVLETPKADRHSALLKVYYGKGKVVYAPIILVTNKSP